MNFFELLKYGLQGDKSSQIDCSGGGWCNVSSPIGSQFSSLSGIVGQVGVLINVAIGTASVVCVCLIVYGGFKYITAGGDAEEIDGAGKILSGAITGLIVVFIAGIIVRFVVDVVAA